MTAPPPVAMTAPGTVTARATSAASSSLNRASPSRSMMRPGEEPAVFATDGGSERVPTRIYTRDLLLAGDVLPGPAIVEQIDSTTVIPPGASARIDEIGNLVLTVQEA